MPGEEKELDLQQFKKLCHFQLTVEEIAAYFEVSPRTVQRRINDPAKDPETGEPLVDKAGKPLPSDYKLAFDEGRAAGRTALRRLQWRHAQQKGSSGVTMTIHLSKFWLGETERSLQAGGGTGNDPDKPRRIKVVGGIANAENRPQGEEHQAPLPNPFDDTETPSKS